MFPYLISRDGNEMLIIFFRPWHLVDSGAGSALKLKSSACGSALQG